MTGIISLLAKKLGIKRELFSLIGALSFARKVVVKCERTFLWRLIDLSTTGDEYAD